MGPVRVGNQAYKQIQHDVFGDIILATTQAFFDKRLLRPAALADFHRLEAVGEHAFRLHALPDASMWEQRGQVRVHTSSALMCWAACDRLTKIAAHLQLPDRARYWLQRAEKIREVIHGRTWNAELASYVQSFEGEEIDASLLLMAEEGFLEPGDARYAGTLAAVERNLMRANQIMRYSGSDDLGQPANSFIICTFWYIEAPLSSGREEEAQLLFEDMLAKRNHLGLLSEDIDVESGELWGNFPQHCCPVN